MARRYSKEGMPECAFCESTELFCVRADEGKNFIEMECRDCGKNTTIDTDTKDFDMRRK